VGAFIIVRLHSYSFMNKTHIEDARQCLQDNNARGMSSTEQPIHWNLHNAISALIKAFEKVEARVAKLEN
jgi:hypothetical protein